MSKGSAPNLSVNIDPMTNRVVGYGYDANGNMLNAQNSTLTYNVENRVASATSAGASAYTRGDPVNRDDPSGKFDCALDYDPIACDPNPLPPVDFP